MHSETTSSIAVAVHADQPRAISPILFGIFFEDLNYAADGGLYAELIQNRSFAYSSAEQRDWNFFTAWELLGSDGSVGLGTQEPVHPNNPHYLVLNLPGHSTHGVGLRNAGFDGIPLKANETYHVSLFARTLAGDIGPLTARLETTEGKVLGEAVLETPTSEWAKYSASIACTASDGDARFVLLIEGSGTLALDVVSLFPGTTYCGRTNGLRPDLAQTIAELNPKFVRFPGGCLAHGDGLDNMYRWKDTIGPIETRREQPNIWSYHQSVGLGYFEYFQFCEDIGAVPVPVVPAGVCCQNTGAKLNGKWGEGQCGLPLDEMPDYIQEVLDLIEWANGPVTSTWGAKRAEAGHPEPFGLKYLGVGNEDHITPVFKERFILIYEAVKAKHPEIVVVGTTGPFHSGEDYDEGWKISNELKLEMVDEHYYEKPEWFWDNIPRYDTYSRENAAIYVGEYAAHESDRKSTLRSALAEAAYMTSLERNGDIVQLASYAPLLAKRHHTQWVPDLIYFDNLRVCPTINYYVQQLFGSNAGEAYLPTTLSLGATTEGLNEKTIAISCVRHERSGDIILKVVSRSENTVQFDFDIAFTGELDSKASCVVLSGEPLAENPFGTAPVVTPFTSTLEVGPQFVYEAPAHSLSVIRIKVRKTA